MKIKCEYCNSYIDETEERCPTCGAANKDFKRVGNQVPTTIEELEKWYKDHNLPEYEVTRFFIGIDYKEPKAFGIYKDDMTGNFVVYKNKDTGERKIRYEGKDEKYAVNELYMRLKEEIVNQKNLNGGRDNGNSKKNKKFLKNLCLFVFIQIVVLIFLSFVIPSRGYYNINNQEYYYVNGNWYVYDNSDWRSTSKPNYSGRVSNYYDGSSYSSSSDYTDITTSSVYDESWDSDDWDSDSSWSSSDSWDSGSTDWGSDW